MKFHVKIEILWDYLTFYSLCGCIKELKGEKMKKNKNGREIWKGILWGAGLLILLLLAIMWYKVIAYDTEENVSCGSDESPDVFFTTVDNDSNWTSWQTVIQLSDNPMDLAVFTGATFDCQVVNNKSNEIKDWNLRFDIVQECFLSGFWCGGFEIHQFRDGKEIVETIANQKVDVHKMDIDINRYSDTPLIHFLPGDYIIYIPSEDAKETVIGGKNANGIGFNLYYLVKMDLSHWTLSYYNNLKLTDLLLFKITLAIVVVWTLMVGLYLILGAFENRLKKEMNNRLRTLSIMADLFIEAYVIDVTKNEAHRFKGNEEKPIMDLVGKNVQETLNELADSRCQEPYRNELKRFLDMSTVFERMHNVTTISYDFYDEQIGWCSIRLFKSKETKNSNQIVLALQDINEEKRKLSLFEDRMNLAEYKQNVSGSFLATVSYALNDISARVMTDGRAILKMTNNEEISTLADKIVMNTRHMNLIQNTMLDLYEIECKRLILNVQPYNVYQMIDELLRILTPVSENRAYEFSVEVDPDLPTLLKGDMNRLEQILVIILFSSLLMTQSGYVKFSVCGKRQGNEEEMIFSIRDSGQGFTDEQLNEIREFIKGSSIETFDNASLVYLKTINGILNYMNSELKIVSVLNEGANFYFAIKQEIVE